MSEREEWADLIRNEYDPAPSHYRMGDNWDDGAGRIADAILADKTLLLRKHSEEASQLGTKLDEIIGHLGGAIIQSIPKDDQIIMDHVRAAYELAKAARRQ